MTKKEKPKILVITSSTSPDFHYMKAALEGHGFDAAEYKCPRVSELQECKQHIARHKDEYAGVVMQHAAYFETFRKRSRDIPSMETWIRSIKEQVPTVIVHDNLQSVPKVQGVTYMDNLDHTPKKVAETLQEKIAQAQQKLSER